MREILHSIHALAVPIHTPSVHCTKTCTNGRTGSVHTRTECALCVGSSYGELFHICCCFRNQSSLLQIGIEITALQGNIIIQ